MPDRIVRAAILTSDAVNTLSAGAEVFYRRLMSVVDDYGRYDGRPSVLLGTLFMLQLSKVSEEDIKRWMKECSMSRLILFYEIDSRPYLEILKFGQRLRAMKSRYPPPTDVSEVRTDVSEVRTDVSEVRTDVSEVRTDVYDLLSESETEDESEVESETEGEVSPTQKKVFKEPIQLIFPYKSEKFMATWNTLRHEKKWRNKSINALQASLKQLSDFDEDFAIDLMLKAISGGYQGVVFSNTKAEYLKSKNGNGNYYNKQSGVSQANAEKLQRIMDGNL